MKIFIKIFNIFAQIVSSVPLGTPQRDKVIKSRFQEEISQIEPICQEGAVAEFNFGFQYYGVSFDITNSSHFKALKSLVEISDAVTVDKIHGDVFIPTILMCHDENLKFDNGWTVQVIGFNGIKKSKLFSGKCIKCEKQYWPSYEEITLIENCTRIRKFYNVLDREYFHLTARSVFEVKLLNQMTYSILIGKMTFRSFAKTYNLLHGSEISHIRFIEAFYAYHVAKRIPG